MDTLPRPRYLGSHSDQQTQWQTSIADRSSSSGWGGRLAELINAANLHEQEYNTIIRRTRLAEGSVGSALIASDTQGVNFNQVFAAANSTIGDQLKSIARLIAAREELGNKRQIFFCQVGGFDQHARLLGPHAVSMTEISRAMKAFRDALVALSVFDKVTTFTASDFNRTFIPNGGGGTDHPLRVERKEAQRENASLENPSSAIPPNPTPIPEPKKEIVLMPIAPIAATLNSTETNVENDISTLEIVLREYRRQYQGNPSGENVEITAALMGNNTRGLGFIPKLGKHHVNAQGELIDRWGIPYFFHVESSTEMEIRSAGPDGEFYTEDDAISSPAAGDGF